MIAKYLELSTRHIKKETIEGLGPDKWPYSYRYEEGMFITVDELGYPDGLPADLRLLIQYAKERDVWLIRLDCDAEEVEDLPTYEWEDDRMDEDITDVCEKLCDIRTNWAKEKHRQAAKNAQIMIRTLQVRLGEISLAELRASVYDEDILQEIEEQDLTVAESSIEKAVLEQEKKQLIEKWRLNNRKGEAL